MTTSAVYLRNAWKKCGARVAMGQVTKAITVELSEDLDTVWTACCLVCPTLTPPKSWARSSTTRAEAARQLKVHFKNQHKNEQRQLEGMV